MGQRFDENQELEKEEGRSGKYSSLVEEKKSRQRSVRGALKGKHRLRFTERGTFPRCYFTRSFQFNTACTPNDRPACEPQPLASFIRGYLSLLFTLTQSALAFARLTSEICSASRWLIHYALATAPRPPLFHPHSEYRTWCSRSRHKRGLFSHGSLTFCQCGRFLFIVLWTTNSTHIVSSDAA